MELSDGTQDGFSLLRIFSFGPPSATTSSGGLKVEGEKRMETGGSERWW